MPPGMPAAKAARGAPTTVETWSLDSALTYDVRVPRGTSAPLPIEAAVLFFAVKIIDATRQRRRRRSPPTREGERFNMVARRDVDVLVCRRAAIC